jgi:hypothetical protein
MKIQIKCFDNKEYNFEIKTQKSAFAVWTLYKAIPGNKALWKTDGLPELIEAEDFYLNDKFEIAENFTGEGFWQHYINLI